MDVTIITAAYNSEKHIRDFFASVLKTEGLTYEVIAVDDGSTDESAKIFSDYAGKNNIQIITLKQNRGGSAARNMAAFAGTGNYICYFDIDARIEPNTVQRLVNQLKQDSTLGMSQAVLLNADGSIESIGHFLTPVGFPYNVDTDYKGRRDKVPTLGTRVAFAIRRELFERIGGYDEDYKIYGEDTDITWRVWQTGHTVYTFLHIHVYHLKQSSLNKKTNFRLYYEGCKNLLNALIKNLPAHIFIWMIPLHIVVWCGISMTLALRGKTEMSMWILKAIWWNMRHLSKTLQKRKAIQQMQHKPVATHILFGPLGIQGFIKKGSAWLRGL